jgi:uncharacterized protein (TIGR02118 family)
MYKVVSVTRFKQGLDRDEAHRLWHAHGQLALQTPGLVRYVQNHWRTEADPRFVLGTHGDGSPAFDGHAELWFRDQPAFEAAMGTDEWLATAEDGPNVFDGSSMVSGVVDEYLMRWDARPDGRFYTA